MATSSRALPCLPRRATEAVSAGSICAHGMPAESWLKAHRLACLRQHVLPDSNRANFAKKGHNGSALDTAYYSYGDKDGWHELRKRMSGRPPPRVFASQLTHAFGHFVQHCNALLNDTATMQRLEV